MSQTTRAPIARVGVDLAKQVIQVHAVDGSGRRVVARALKRDQFFDWCAQLPPGCMVAMEACSSAHHWARKLRALGLDARLIAANFVTPNRMEGRSGKNDATDAAATLLARAMSIGMHPMKWPTPALGSRTLPPPKPMVLTACQIQRMSAVEPHRLSRRPVGLSQIATI